MNNLQHLHSEMIMSMPVIDIKPLPNSNGNIEQGLKNLCASIPKDTVILCPYISNIFAFPK